MKLSLHCRSRTQAAMMLLVALLPPTSSAQEKTVLLPFRSAHSLILVDAKVNGKPAILLLDTGANKTIIDARTCGNVQASRMELTSKGPGIEGNALRLRVDLEIAGRFLFSRPVSVISLGDLAQHLGVQFDGLLGQDILRQFHSVCINYHAHVIELQR